MSKILLVEDDNNLREIYEARLQAEGFTISSASNGEDALVLVKKELPDLIISDVMMPKISGFEMLDIIKNTPGLENIKVIMLTALGQNDDQDRAGKLGADRYLVKSQVTLENIVNVAQELLGNNSTNMNEQINNSAMPNPNDLSKPIEPAYNTINVDPSPIDNQLPTDTNSTVSPVDNLTTPAPQPAVIDNSTVSPNDNLATPAPQPAVIDNSVTLDNNIPAAINNNDPTTIPIDNNNVMVATDQNIAPSTTDQNNQQVIETPLQTNTDFNPANHITEIDLPDMQKSADEQNTIKNQINYFITTPTQNSAIDTSTLPVDNTINVDPSPIDNQLPTDTNPTVSPVDNLVTPAPQPAVIDNSANLDNNIPTAINNNDPTTIPIDNNNVMVATDQNIAPSTTDQNNQQVIDQAVNTLNDQMSNNDNLDSSSLPFSPPSLSPPSGSQRTINPINNSTPIFSNTTNPIDAPDSNLSTAPQPNFDNSSINNDLNNIAL